MRTIILLAFSALLLSATAANAEFYRWVDKEGKEHFTNDLNKVPSEYRSGSAPVTSSPERVSVGEKPVSIGKSSSVSNEHKDKYGRGEEYWRKKAANLRLKLRDLQDDYDLALKQIEELEHSKKLNSRSKKSHTAIDKKKQKLEKDIAKTRRALEADLPEEARKADAYPGWIRE